MGLCLSQQYRATGDFSTRAAAPVARVISSSGSLRQYAVPVTVSKVLESEVSFSSSSSRSSALFLCNSDSLCYEEPIPSMASDDRLAVGQIYFALPMSRLGRPLSASDMAALAVKASLALQKAGGSGSGSRRGRRSQISPVLEAAAGSRRAVEGDDTILGDSSLKLKPSGSEGFEKTPPAPARKYRRSSSSRKFKRAVRSFRIRLSTIQEGESVRFEQCCRN